MASPDTPPVPAEQAPEPSGARGRILVAADSFKGTMTSLEVAEAMRAGLSDSNCEVTVLEAADGGEGTASALLAATGGSVCRTHALDPLGRPIEAEWAMLDNGDAVVEVAAASGLNLLADDERDGWAADSYGTGQLIAAAAAAGARRVLVAAGGSATTDGGDGAVRALHDAAVKPEIEVLCDVRTPYEAAARTFGPQKGADPAVIRRLERRLDRVADAAPRDPRGAPMTGAAGGLSGGLWAHSGARLRPGAEFVLDALGFDDVVRENDVVLTGEGRLDETSLEGKLVGEVANRSRSAGVRCHALVGRCELAASGIRHLGLASVCEAGSAAAISDATHALARAGFDPRADG